MKFIRFLLCASWGMVALGTTLSLLSGMSKAALLVVINSALHNSVTSTGILAAAFIGIAAARVFSDAISQFLLARFAAHATTQLRRELCYKSLNTPLRQLEQIGIPKLMVTLTEDINAISRALRNLQTVAVDIALILGAIIYLGWLSWPSLLIMLAVTAVGLLFQRGLMKKAFHALRLAREEENTLFHHFRALTEGMKELRIHNLRREKFLSKNIHGSTEALENLHIESTKRFVCASVWNQLSFVAIIGAVLVFFPALKNIPSEVLTGYVLTILYIMGPLRQLTNMLPHFGRADIALQRIDNLGLSLAQHTLPESSVNTVARSWKRLELRKVTFTYRHEVRDGDFTLGPVDFTLQPGEILFVVGGNGSGKSTLAKLVVGLYTPESGEIYLDEQPISDQKREWYRQHFSVIFSDFYLFEDLLGLECPSLDQRARDYLSLLQLEHKVQVQNGGLSTTALSQGQRRRLALLTAYLEDRPIYVFDEWAADQDPYYKNIFYTQLLPELKARGKGVIVITHDDRYFDLADRIFKLDYGKPVIEPGNPTAIVSAHSRPSHRRAVPYS